MIFSCDVWNFNKSKHDGKNQGRVENPLVRQSYTGKSISSHTSIPQIQLLVMEKKFPTVAKQMCGSNSHNAAVGMPP